MARHTRILASLLGVVLLLGSMGVTGCAEEPPSDGAAVSGETAVRVRMLVKEVRPEVAESFSEGETVRVKTSGATLGEIVGVEVEPAREAVPTAEGELAVADNPVLENVYLDIEGEADVGEKGFSFDGTYVYINEDVVFLTPTVSFFGLVTSMEPVE